MASQPWGDPVCVCLCVYVHVCVYCTYYIIWFFFFFDRRYRYLFCALCVASLDLTYQMPVTHSSLIPRFKVIVGVIKICCGQMFSGMEIHCPVTIQRRALLDQVICALNREKTNQPSVAGKEEQQWASWAVFPTPQVQESAAYQIGSWRRFQNIGY